MVKSPAFPESRPDFVDPRQSPPSTKKISGILQTLLEQSANLPGRLATSNADLRRVTHAASQQHARRHTFFQPLHARDLWIFSYKNRSKCSRIIYLQLDALQNYLILSSFDLFELRITHV